MIRILEAVIYSFSQLDAYINDLGLDYKYPGFPIGNLNKGGIKYMEQKN